MRLLTHSRLAAFRACPRKHLYAYTRRYKPVRPAPALAFGTAAHEALKVYWEGRQRGTDVDDCIRQALASVLHDSVDLDAFEEAKLRAMVAGYGCAWALRDVTVLAVEREFALPLRNPDSGFASRDWRLAGKIDLIVRERTGAVTVVEHKTTSDSAAPGTGYRQRLATDGQVQQYLAGAAALGYDATSVVYDVLSKPRLRPRDGETPEQFELRILADVAQEPSKYFQTVQLARDEALEARYRVDVWKLSQLIDDAEATYAVHNPDACFRFGAPCEYWPVCSGTASLDDERYYRRAELEHAELSGDIQKGVSV